MSEILKQLSQLASERRNLADQLIANNDNSHKIIAEQLYDKQTHFIFELLQNAEDENATEAQFELNPTSLVFRHNGKPFTFEDIKSVSNFGDNSLKNAKANAIGRFGIGFKSVYAITSSPIILSDIFHIEIKDYNVPTIISSPEPSNETIITLPFNHNKKSPEQIFELLKTELESFEATHLLFLRNLKAITFNISGSSIRLDKRSAKEKSKAKNLQIEKVKLNENGKALEYLVAKRGIIVENKPLEVQLAFAIAGSGKKRNIQKLDRSPLYVFFPTGKETNLSFLVHAPFATTPARDNILDGLQGNTKLQEAAAQLFADILFELKGMNLLNAGLLNNLPINKEECSRSEIYKHLYEALKTTLLSKAELVPLTTGGFASATDVLLTGSAELAALLNPAQSKKLFGKKYWIDKNITENKTKLLRDFFFKDLNVPEPDLAKFATEITEDFLKAQTDKWITEFYKVIHQSRLVWKDTPKQKNNAAWILRNKAIIRDELNNQVIPFDATEKPNIYLPTKAKSDYPIVKKRIAADKDALKFFEELGLTTPKLLDEVNEFILPKFESAPFEYFTSQEYLDDLVKIITAYEKAPADKRLILISDLKATSFLLVRESNPKELSTTIPALAYFPDELLLDYFEYGYADFVVNDILKLEESRKLKVREFLFDLGVSDVPRRCEINAVLTDEEKQSLRYSNDGCTWDKIPIDYYLDGLNEIIVSGITFEKSVIIWKAVCECLKRHDDYWNTDYFFKGKYVYKYYDVKTRFFNASFYNDLTQNAWLVSEDGELKLPKEITLEELPSVYKKDIEITEKLASLLGFKLDIIKDFEQKTGYKVYSYEEQLEFERLKKMEQDWLEEKQTKAHKDFYTFEPEIAAGSKVDLPLIIDDTIFENSFAPTLNPPKADAKDPSVKSGELESEDEDNDDGLDDPSLNISSKTLKAIGNWGEEDVRQMLIVEFTAHSGVEIINCNAGGTGRGYDFIIKENGEIIRYVEVKTSVGSISQKHIISGTQWETARKLYEAGEGDKYWVYCIFNAGLATKHTKIIKNPIKLWHEGKIIADPINFVVNLKKGALVSENL